MAGRRQRGLEIVKDRPEEKDSRITLKFSTVQYSGIAVQDSLFLALPFVKEAAA